MMSMFSSFDMNMYMLTILSSSILLVKMLSFNNNQKLTIKNKMFSTVLGLLMNIKMNLMKKFNKMEMSINISLMIMIFLLNFMSILSYNFTLTSQMSMIMSMALIMWTTVMMFTVMKNLKNLLIHLIPMGCPMMLILLLSMIELVSSLIRPITLSVRLMANILAGHILMILLSKILFLNILVYPLYMMLNLIEFGVSMIQSYIFTTMTVLYLSETK